jgi:hypothetical protein
MLTSKNGSPAVIFAALKNMEDIKNERKKG